MTHELLRLVKLEAQGLREALEVPTEAAVVATLSALSELSMTGKNNKLSKFFGRSTLEVALSQLLLPLLLLLLLLELLVLVLLLLFLTLLLLLLKTWSKNPSSMDSCLSIMSPCGMLIWAVHGIPMKQTTMNLSQLEHSFKEMPL